jgi:exodeoxyribonuclease V beta subunit
VSATAQILHPTQFPLWGSRLIEASAGTGKTYTIAALYVRLILGHGQSLGPVHPMSPKDILVMTFTKAATQELTTRIQQRLAQAAEIFRGQRELHAHDLFLKELLEDYPTQALRDHAAWRLNEAAQCMDEACIYTIDAWCQRVLKEYAVYSGQPFDEELLSNQDQLRQQALEDFWRQSIYPLSTQRAQMLKEFWPNEIDDLKKLVKSHAFELDNSLVVLDSQAVQVEDTHSHHDLDAHLCALLEGRRRTLQALKLRVRACIEVIFPWIESLNNTPIAFWNFQTLSRVHLLKWLTAIKAWCDQEARLDNDLDDKHWGRLTWGSIQRALRPEAPPLTPPQELLEFEALGEEVFAIPKLEDAVADLCLKLIQEKMNEIKKQNSSFGFADLLGRLNAKLHEPQAPLLRGLIKKQYPVILIDEFQDTSSLQYSIFNAIYEIDQNDKNYLICLIADPKQSIYAFRGADIKSYLRAKEATRPRHYYLERNFRSTLGLVSSVNRWFEFAQTHAAWGAFLYKVNAQRSSVDNSQDPSYDALPFHPVKANGLENRLVRTRSGARLPLPSVSLVCDLEPQGSDSIRKKFAALCAQRIVDWLSDETLCFEPVSTVHPGESASTQAVNGEGLSSKRIKPADIAVLVRTSTEAVAVRRALTQRGVASVYLSDKDSVFETPEARDILCWLDAVAHPRRTDKVRAALATATIGLEFEEIHAMAQDEITFDAFSEVVSELHQVWLQSGVMAMLRSTLHRLSLPKRWLNNELGERRLTNYLHLSELLQTASLTQLGTQSLVNWLREAIHEPAFQTDEHILRLESDADLVKVITIHKSKGLEFSLVCLPFPTLFNTKAGKKNRPHPYLLRNATTDDERDEALRELMRLFYVAMTRAKYTLWLGFALFKEGNSSQDLTAQSALGYLIRGHTEGLKPEEWRERLHLFFDELNGSTEEEWLEVTPTSETQDTPQTITQGFMVDPEDAKHTLGVNKLGGNPPSKPLRAHSAYTASFDRSFKIQSFSSLLRNASPHASVVGLTSMGVANEDESQAWEWDSLEPLGTLVPPQPEVLGLSNTPQSPVEPPPRLPLAAGPLSPWREVPGGMRVGTFIHETLQWMIQEGLEAVGTPEGDARLLQRMELTWPLELSTPREWGGTEGSPLNAQPRGQTQQTLKETFLAWFNVIALTPLAPLGINLKQLSQSVCEMEFWLAAQAFQAQRVDQLCQHYLFPPLERPALTPTFWHGLMMGFADLIFEHEGRFWLMDYKSNFLGLEDDSYSAENLARDVVKNRYELQMAIYLLALHRLLKARLGPSYSLEKHLGGAIIWYVRGINSATQGLCLLPSSAEMIRALEGMVSPDTVPKGPVASGPNVAQVQEHG